MTDDTLIPDTPSSGATDDATPIDPAEVHTPEWVCTAASPLTATLAAGEAGKPVALWPTAQRSDATQRAGWYAPDEPKHPGRLLPDLARWIILQHSEPGQKILGLFCGSGTSVVEAVYAGRDAVGVDNDSRWGAVARANLAYARDRGATGTGRVMGADARWLGEVTRRERRSIDLLIATPPSRLTPLRRGTRARGNQQLINQLAGDLMCSIFYCLPLLRPGGTVVFVTRLIHRGGQLLDLTYPVKDAARWNGLDLIGRAAALRVPTRDAQLVRPRPPSQRPKRRRRTPAPPVVHDEVLVFRVPTRWQRWLKGEL